MAALLILGAGGDKMRAPVEGGTRERILIEAQALFADAGYHGAGLQEIARRAGLRKASLFHHFASKADLYRAVLDLRVAETEALVRAVLQTDIDAEAKLCSLVDAYVDLVAEHPQHSKILLRQSLDDAADVPLSAAAQRLLDLLIDFLESGQRRGTFADTDAAAFVLGLIGSVTFLLTSAAAFAPAWPREPLTGGSVARVKQHVRQLTLRHLLPAR